MFLLGITRRETEGRTLAKTLVSGCYMFDGNLVSRHIRRVLDTTGGRIEGEQGAARLLGVNPSTLRHMMGKLGVPFGRKAGKH